ncbi:YebC/PmpR family DNA-binding transcriptional regulator [uncultured Finegoldia sp.]|uniref:YebC/PmpR family DNA-binding transcriptional regulator n=1 Tax=uncultured Finegoldia sp. TaxID=328009 RepID=UPI00260607DB|nr:YebC/PmpR family DNA-binding transcriptional regulator [uncultured Finegoldia sp.]
MSGHNKWSKIKNKKGSEDARRGKVFTKMARAISVAVREGGADPEYNPSLKSVIEKARAENMPNDNIDRAIKKASGDGDSANYENIIYEGYGPEGVAVIVECLTDNRNRTASDVRHYFDKFGGNLGQNGSVSFMFQRKGLLLIDSESLDEEEVMMDSLDAGAEDFEVEDGVFVINTAMEDFAAVRDTLLEKGYKFIKSDLVYEPANYVKINDQSNIDKMEKLIDNLEDSDDVQQVSHNWDNE